MRVVLPQSILFYLNVTTTGSGQRLKIFQDEATGPEEEFFDTKVTYGINGSWCAPRVAKFFARPGGPVVVDMTGGFLERWPAVGPLRAPLTRAVEMATYDWLRMNFNKC